MWKPTRRECIRVGVATAAAAGWAALGGRSAWGGPPPSAEVPPGDRPPQDAAVRVLHPRGRVPLSFIIDDSTCLVNMGRFCMPQFYAAMPSNPAYRKKWQNWPAEIPDAFLREFGEFAAEQGVRGKFSLVPYPACVGWLDRELPGWSRTALQDSLKLVRELMLPRWDITPEMITHTHVIDIKTGRPLPGRGQDVMENWYPPESRSADELAAYITYALNILKNAEIPCAGVTTPGGFGNKCRSNLSLAMRQAQADVFGTEIPFYFKYISEGDENPRPRVEHAEGLGTGVPKVIVDVPAGIGDNFGDWDGDRPPTGDKYATADASAGRMVDLIEAGEPAVMFGHWAGFYSNGSKAGFEACKKVITALNTKYKDRTVWMKTSELARYWATRELTGIERALGKITLSAPYACPDFTLSTKATGAAPPKATRDGQPVALAEAKDRRALAAGTWLREKDDVIVCWNLEKGRTVLEV